MTAPRVLPAPAVAEDDFTDQVLELARIFKWRTAHFRPALTRHGWRTPVQGDGKGWPDLVLVRPPRIVFAELKRDAVKKVAPDQEIWLDALRACPGVEVYLWRPRDLDDIARILRPDRRVA